MDAKYVIECDAIYYTGNLNIGYQSHIYQSPISNNPIPDRRVGRNYYQEAVLLMEERKIAYESALERVANFKNDIGLAVFGKSGNVWEDGIIELICEYL